MLNPLEFRGNYSATPTSNNNYEVDTPAVDGWAVTFTFGTVRRGLGRGRRPPRPLLTVLIVTAHPSTASIVVWSVALRF